MFDLCRGPWFHGLRWWLWLSGLAILFANPVNAHLISPQRGTLNFVNGGGYMMLSLPVSAFPYADDDGDHLLSQAEYLAHKNQMAKDIEANVQLLDAKGALNLEGTFLNFTPPDNAPDAPAAQIIVLGRFNPRNPGDISNLRWRIGLFGVNADEKNFQVTVARTSPITGEKERQALSFNPQIAERSLFPSQWAVIAQYTYLGIHHIGTGLDHLLFLLVVLAAMTGWRQVLLALTCFTLGHSITLAFSLLGSVTVASAVVEPAIALTIVGVALYDLWARSRGHHVPLRLNLGLVFGCALIHGLGLASSLAEMGLDRSHLWESLVGFNVGIELGQIAVSIGVAAVAFTLARLVGAASLQKARALAGIFAVGTGGYWFVQRIVSM